MPTEPVSQEEFTALMAHLGPFEQQPHLAVAVSGGADSMALCLLTDRWAREIGGRVTALVVDHGLRPTSGSEAQAVIEGLAQRGIQSEILKWKSKGVSTGIQAAARQARYDLLNTWCRRNAVLHLLTAHHSDDQAETVLSRLSHGSGPDGLAGMSPVVEFTHCRLLRPLLSIGKNRLIETARAAGVSWVNDPSNANPVFERTRHRGTLSQNPGLAAGLVVSAKRFGRLRAYVEGATAAFVGRHARVDAAGYVTISFNALAEAPEEIAVRALVHGARSVGGLQYPVSVSNAETVLSAILSGKGGSAGRCHFVKRGHDVVIARENRNLPRPVKYAGRRLFWDGRFEISGLGRRSSVVPYAHSPCAETPRNERPQWLTAVPDVVRYSLPVMDTGDGWWPLNPYGTDNSKIKVRFRPPVPVGGSGFFIA